MPTEAWVARPLTSSGLLPEFWTRRGFALVATGAPVVAEESDDDDVATGPEEEATGRTAMLAPVASKKGPVAEPLPKKIRGSAGAWADLEDSPVVEATSPEPEKEDTETKTEGDVATGQDEDC